MCDRPTAAATAHTVFGEVELNAVDLTVGSSVVAFTHLNASIHNHRTYFPKICTKLDYSLHEIIRICIENNRHMKDRPYQKYL